MSIEAIQLPEDVLMDVLSRIPAKSLLRFKSVSNHWYSLIQNPYFISLHHSRAPPYDCITISRTIRILNLHTVENSMYLLPNQTSIHDLDLSFTKPPHIKDTWLHDSCNGLLCLSNEPSIVICNPAIREFRVLPQPPNESRHTSNLGFGFDPKSNDYKVLRVATLYESDPEDSLEAMPVDHTIQIYGMSTNSWKEIVTMVPNHYQKYCSPTLYPCISLDGVFYWLGNDVSTCIPFIYTFRMFEELFERIPFPEGFLNKAVQSIYILKNSLAAVVPESDQELRGIRFDIWVMDESQVMASWTKKYTIEPLLALCNSMGFRPNAEIFLMTRHVESIVSYNLISGDINEYNQLWSRCSGDINEYNQFCSRPEPWHFAQILAYSESLISVKRRVD